MKSMKNKKLLFTKGHILKIGVKNPNLDGMSAALPKQKILSPYDVFNKCISRAKNLIACKQCKDKKENVGDFYRAAVVLSISALDAFIRTTITTRIKDIVLDKKNVGDELYKYLEKLLPHKELFNAARQNNFLQKIENVLKKDFEIQSFQGEEKISTFLKMIGHNDIFSNVSKKINKNEGNLIKQLNDYTKRRHTIAHRGDYDLNQNPVVEIQIDYLYASSCVKFVEEITKAINEIINKE